MRRRRRPARSQGNNRWLKLGALSKHSTAIAIAAATVVGSVYVPTAVNDKSLETQKIIQLSTLIKSLYSDSSDATATLIAMTSHGAPAVPFLRLALMHAAEQSKSDDDEYSVRAEQIENMLRYMDDESHHRIEAALRQDIEQLTPDKTGYTVKYMTHMVRSVTGTELSGDTVDSFRQYFLFVGRLTHDQDAMAPLNAAALRALQRERPAMSWLRERGRNIGRALRPFGIANKSPTFRHNISFANWNLSGADLTTLSLADSESVLNHIAQADWHGATLTDEVRNYLARLDTTSTHESFNDSQ